MKRHDGRKNEDIREIEAKVGIIKNARGSAMFRTGNTTAYAAVYGPKQENRYVQEVDTGVLQAKYSMMPFSGMGDRIRPAPSRREREISMVTTKALSSVVRLEKFPNSVINVHIAMTQTDAGSRTAGINAGSLALADAGFPMKDLISSIAVGRIDDELLVDLDYEEEAADAVVADIPLAIIPSTKEIALFQMDGFVDKKQIPKLLDLAFDAADRIKEVQIKALKESYKVEGDLDEE